MRSSFLNQRRIAQRQRRERERLLMKQARERQEKISKQRDAEVGGVGGWGGGGE